MLEQLQHCTIPQTFYSSTCVLYQYYESANMALMSVCTAGLEACAAMKDFVCVCSNGGSSQKEKLPLADPNSR